MPDFNNDLAASVIPKSKFKVPFCQSVKIKLGQHIAQLLRSALEKRYYLALKSHFRAPNTRPL